MPRSTHPGRHALRLIAMVAFLGSGAWVTADHPKPPWLDLEPVWSGHPVGFCLLTQPPHQFAAYYDAERRMTVAQRRLEESTWKFVRLPSVLGWDSHNYVTMAIDRAGHLHVAGNMHVAPLVYFRTTRPGDAATLERVPALAGDHESRVTYPVFFRDRTGRLLFRYRHGHSGDGDDLFHAYDETSRRWTRLLDSPLLGGEGQRNAYASVPELGPDQRFHMIWVWRESADCATNHTLSYARSDDLVHWTDSAGRPCSLPITSGTGEVVDPVPPGGGLLNGHCKLGFDHAGRVVITYHKYDPAGDLQIYAARREDPGWVIRQLSDWHGYRWEFSGGGTIITEVGFGAVRKLDAGRLAVDYLYPKGSGTWVLDEATLRPMPGVVAPRRPKPQFPREIDDLNPAFPDLRRKHCSDSGTAPGNQSFQLVWYTLPSNRDRPRTGPLPPPSMLRLLWSGPPGGNPQ